MKAYGIDISKYQETFEPQGNIDFIIQRVSYGLRADEKFKILLPGVKQVERRGAYHYFYTGIDPIEQAEFFYAQQGNQGFKFLALDYEKTGNVLDAQGEANLTACYIHLKTLTDKPILLYTSPYIYRDNIHAYNPSWNLENLWVAHYADEPDLLGVRDDWLFWQYTSKGIGKDYGVGSTFVDLNEFNGTVEELDDWLGLEPPPVDCCEEVKRLRDEVDLHTSLLNELGFNVSGNADKIASLQEKSSSQSLHIAKLAKDITALQERMSLNEMIADNNYTACNERLDRQFEIMEDLQEQIDELQANDLALVKELDGLGKEIDDITVPETNHSHRKLFSWLFNK